MSSVVPFSSGCQALDWFERNCCRCKKSERADHDGPITPTCEIEAAIGEAFFCGTVSNNIAERMGLVGDASRLTWDCPERDDR